MAVLYPDDVGIILSYQCPNSCAHCIYNCGPRRRAVMTLDTLRAALDALLIYPRPPQIHLTGGEPFLHYDLLLLGARLAAERGLVAYLETSASWCVDDETTLARFAELREAGLQAVLISCSPFHAERVPLARTLRAIRAAQRVFGPARTLVYQASYLELLRRLGPEEQPIPLERYAELYGEAAARALLWDEFGIIPGGRAGYRLGQLTEKRPATAFAGQPCAGTLLYAQHSHCDLHGNFVPGFCGGLSVGDWRDLPVLLADFQAGRYPPLIKLLIERGPYALYELALAQGYQPLAEGYAGKCHLCVDARRHLFSKGNYPELQPGEFYELGLFMRT